MVLDTSLLDTQQYKVRIKGKVEQSRDRSSAFPYTSEVLVNMINNNLKLIVFYLMDDV